jgi:hypothetical protein
MVYSEPGRTKSWILLWYINKKSVPFSDLK